MTTPKLTPWFPASVKPVHVGVYEVEDGIEDNEVWYSHWDGKKFNYWCCGGPEMAYEFSDMRISLKPDKWRGLAEKPG